MRISKSRHVRKKNRFTCTITLITIRPLRYWWLMGWKTKSTVLNMYLDVNNKSKCGKDCNYIDVITYKFSLMQQIFYCTILNKSIFVGQVNTLLIFNWNNCTFNCNTTQGSRNAIHGHSLLSYRLNESFFNEFVGNRVVDSRN